MRILVVAPAFLALLSAQANGCQPVPPTREPTLAERLGGSKQVFGGTVVGYIIDDTEQRFGPVPQQCLDEVGHFNWWDEVRLPECIEYLGVTAALFRVDVPIVGPAADEIATYSMTWGDGDCNADFNIGEKWLISERVIEELHAPIRDDEIATLRRLSSLPAFDFRQLYPSQNQPSSTK